MDTSQLKEQVNQIEISKKMEEEILSKCYKKTEEKHMSKNTIKKFKVKPIAAVAALALCLCVTGITSMAATGKLEGFFRDIKNWNGAVTGTSYEQATDEVEVSSSVADGKVVVTLTMLKQDAAPYFTFENLGIEKYQILDSKGNVILEGTTEKAEIDGNKVEIEIMTDNMAKGHYKLLVTQLVSSSKADQPLILTGNWECEFVY